MFSTEYSLTQKKDLETTAWFVLSYAYGMEAKGVVRGGGREGASGK